MTKLKDKGITLVALVVTVVILLILAGVAIGTLRGENGLIVRTQQAKKETRYKEAKEKINIELMDIQVECTEQRKEYNIKEIALNMKETEEITINKTYNREVASIKEGIQIDEEKVEGIVVSVDKCSEYKFLIGKSTKIEGVLETEDLDTIAMSDFIDIETFEKNLFKINKMEGTIITYTTKPEGYTNQDSIKVTIKISNTKGIRTIEFPDGGSIECFGKTEYSKDYPSMVNDTYTYKVTDMEGNKTTKEIIIDRIDKLEPKDFTISYEKTEKGIKVIGEAEDAEADEISSKSGIDYYEYYVTYSNGTTTKYDSREIEITAGGIYKIYAIAYDRAGNTKRSNTIDVQIIKTVKVSAGDKYGIGIDSEGTLWAWGFNNAGQLGNGTTTNSISPVQIKSETKFKEISSGTGHNLGIDSEGRLWSWGYNGSGELGNGTTTYKSVPGIVKSGTKFSKISAGNGHSLGIDSEGNLWAWGCNDSGSLGDGTTTSRTSPVQIKSGTKFSKISAGHYQSLGIDNQEKLWTWGNNKYGQLGDGTTESKTSPVQIKSGTKFKEISAGIWCSFGIDDKGNLYGMGYSYYLGDENLLALSPKQIN